MAGRWLAVKAGATNRFGPTLPMTVLAPIRLQSTGSVRMLMPKKFMRTVECPSHAAVIAFGFQEAGTGTADGFPTLRPASATMPRTMRAPYWSEDEAQTLTAPKEPRVRNRRRETGFCRSLLKFSFFKCLMEL